MDTTPPASPSSVTDEQHFKKLFAQQPPDISDYDKEAVYETEIKPLIEQIEKLCTEHRIPHLFFVQFCIRTTTDGDKQGGVATSFDSTGRAFQSGVMCVRLMQHAGMLPSDG